MPAKAAPKSSDPRVRRTRRLLRDALISLLLEKDFASISIKDVTQRAEVAYITFFRHCESLEQLLMEILDEGLGDLMTRITTLAAHSEADSLETEGRLIFEYIGQKAELFRVLLKSQSVIRIRKRVVRNIALIFQKSCLPLARSGNATATAILSNHIATSLLALVEWWLDHSMKPPAAQMGRVYKSLIIDSTISAVRPLAAVSR